MPLTEAARKMIQELEETRLQQLSELTSTERLINELLQRGGEPSRYADETANRAIVAGLKRGQFYMKPLATAVREFMLTRMEPLTGDEILKGLEAGEFDFDAMGWKKETRLRSLAMSLAKNTATFHRLPSGTFGLREWYPNLPQQQPKKPVRAISLGGLTDTDSAGPDLTEDDQEP